MAPPSTNPNQGTKWADGLRGIASLLVVTAHIFRSLHPELLAPAVSQDGPSIPLQLPFLRCLIMGRASVAAFAILAGYVNALKPTRQARAGQVDAAFSGIAKSAFRRTGRFMIPAVVATTLSWLACQLGAYHVANYADSQWLRDTSPHPSASLGRAFIDLYWSLLGTWTTGANAYDKIQWTLCYLLRGSMLVYLTLFATTYVKPRWRLAFYAMFYCYYYALKDSVIGINVYFGLILAEIQCDPEIMQFVEDRPRTFGVLTPILMGTGLYLMSYPEDHPEWARWSTDLTHLGHIIFPHGSELARFFPGLGVEIFVSGVMFNATVKKVLSHRYICWIGKMSFAVYLIHAPLLRTVLAWMIYGLSSRPASQYIDEHGTPLPPGFRPEKSKILTMIAVPLFYVILYRLAALWVAYVDPWCGRVTNWVERKTFKDDLQQEKVFMNGHTHAVPA